ncbi:D-alanyl-D-alanine carboxypeptidase [Bacillus infantis]|uniref:D-alanyl-D-alanine carboxypeptidase n=2 Tax=Bacillus infantis TaxID=324767 RepID=A0A5D4S189_9BACI|nr:D-alanyl-D-alanine carboxypeptidase [Bacillus infantis]TYS55810.1 D-alanyl-D-alanine carboxypeptidase [Bacillus infantis]
MQKDLLLNSMGTQLTDMKLANMQKDALMNSLGQEVTKLKLEMMSMKGGESG